MMEASAIILVDSEGRVRYKIHALKDGALRDPSPFSLERIAAGARQLAEDAARQAEKKRAENLRKLEAEREQAAREYREKMKGK